MRVVLILSPDGVETIRAVGNSDTETKEAEAIVGRIKPALDYMKLLLNDRKRETGDPDEKALSQAV